MMASLHCISDSEDEVCVPSTSYSGEHYTIPKLKPNLSLHEISDSEDEVQENNKRKRSSSWDSDKTLDPDEDPDLFKALSKRIKGDVSDSDSDVTIDLSLEGSSSDKNQTKSPIKKQKYSPQKSKSMDHIISESDSDSNICTTKYDDITPNGSKKLTSPSDRTQHKNEHQRSSPGRRSSLGHSTSSETGKVGSAHKKSPLGKTPPGVNRNSSLEKAGVRKRALSMSGSEESDGTVDLEVQQKSPSQKSADKRPPCKYGNQCYRKNPSHFKHFTHPEGKTSMPYSSGASTETQKSLLDSALNKASTSSNKTASYKSTGAVDTPLGFLLTKVSGIDPKYNGNLAVDIKDLLSPAMGALEKSAQFNYMTDIPWLVAQYPPEFRSRPLLLVHGFQRKEKAGLQQEASSYKQMTLCQAKLDMPYGTHHTKMMLLVYDNGMRVVIHTANLIHGDWHQKTQGVWLSPLFPRLAADSSRTGDSETHFRQDLVEYLVAYRAPGLDEWIQTIKQHDMSAAQVFIIGSVPGRHLGQKKHSFGHLKLRKVLQQFGPTPLHVKNWPVIGQFSSIGSLGNSKDGWVCSEWLSSLCASRGSGLGQGAPLNKPTLIFPSKDNVRMSLEGYPAGASLPYSINTAKKQPWLHNFFHQWLSDYRGRSRASPHIKTYLRASPDWRNIAWFMVTSANLSKAAWGALEKNGLQLMIRSYELGVLLLPEQFGTVSSFRTMTNLSESISVEPGRQLVLPVPYDLPPTEYTKGDRPWVWDIPYVDKPDSHGNKWCPR